MIKSSLPPVLGLLFIMNGLIARGQQLSDTSKIREHLLHLTKTPQPRMYSNWEQLEATATYLFDQFYPLADTTFFQEYSVDGIIYKNVIASFGTAHSSRIIVGAHYDVCGPQQGADDNASGVVGLLELGRLLKNQQTNKRIDLVVYTLEEPPFFRTEYMGSYQHAKSLIDQNIQVEGMVVLEMIGYFDDRRKTQDYPLGILKLFYGSKGDYITLVKKFAQGSFARQFGKNFKQAKTIKTKTFAGPKSLPGIDFSDHLNYWRFGISALMITDTAFYRNKNYHQTTDTIETLDLHRMSLVINAVYEALLNL